MVRAGGQCDHCGRTSTPCWRKGPPEKPCLCNACGVRWLVKHSLDGYMPTVKPAATVVASSNHAADAQHAAGAGARGAAASSDRGLRKRKERSTTPDEQEPSSKVLFGPACAAAGGSLQLHQAVQHSMMATDLSDLDTSQQQRQSLRQRQRRKRQADDSDILQSLGNATMRDSGSPYYALAPQNMLLTGQGQAQGGYDERFSMLPGYIGDCGPNVLVDGSGPCLHDAYGLVHYGGDEHQQYRLAQHGAFSDYSEAAGTGQLHNVEHNGMCGGGVGGQQYKQEHADWRYSSEDGSGDEVAVQGPEQQAWHRLQAPTLMADVAGAAASLATLHSASHHLFATPVVAPRRPRKQARPVACC